MNLDGQYTFDAPQDTVWQVLMDPDAIAQALPGVDKLIPIDGEPDAWHADAKIKIATVSGTYSGTIRMSEQNPPTQYRLTVAGEGQNSIINGTALISLAPNTDDNNKTEITWEAEANISGKLAGIGQRLVGAAANMMSKRFFNDLASQIPNKE